jgi:hypothetical protein
MSLASRLYVAWNRYSAPDRFFGRPFKLPQPATGEIEEQGVGILGPQTATVEVAGKVFCGPMPSVNETPGNIREVLNVVGQVETRKSLSILTSPSEQEAGGVPEPVNGSFSCLGLGHQ